MSKLQNFIHKLEEGTYIRILRGSLAVLAVLALLVCYNWLAFRNFYSAEAMDSAQLARNLATGHEYTTEYVRPLSIHLLKQQAERKLGIVGAATAEDVAQLKGDHPDLANPPVYPALLAAAMKVLPFRWEIDSTKPFWGSAGQFLRHQPDFLIGIVNQLLFLVVVFLTFRLARKLFDQSVAWLSALLLLGCEMMWRFSGSGLSTMLVLVIFLGVVHALVALEAEARAPQRGFKKLLLMALAAGVLVGLGGLTRYAFGWMIIPVAVYVGLVGGPRRVALSCVVIAAAALVMLPWIIRNFALSGLPFGTASYAVLEGSFAFQGAQLQRSLDPDFTLVGLTMFIYKFMGNTREILQDDLLRLADSWAMPFFLVGLMLSFRNPAIRRLRYFLLGCLGTLFVVQAMGKTYLSTATPEINTENLLILLFPLVLIYAVGVFFVLLEQINFAVRELRYAVLGLFALLMCLPLIYRFLPPRTNPVSWPPYNPPVIQVICGFMKPDELMMSDIPWAVAWYGNRQCIQLTLNAQKDFFAVNDMLKPVRALYLSPETMNSRILSDMLWANERSWGAFVLDSGIKGRIPEDFPLQRSLDLNFPQQFFLSDWDRWRVSKDVIQPERNPTEETNTKAGESK